MIDDDEDGCLYRALEERQAATRALHRRLTGTKEIEQRRLAEAKAARDALAALDTSQPVNASINAAGLRSTLAYVVTTRGRPGYHGQ